MRKQRKRGREEQGRDWEEEGKRAGAEMKAIERHQILHGLVQHQQQASNLLCLLMQVSACDWWFGNGFQLYPHTLA